MRAEALIERFGRSSLAACAAQFPRVCKVCSRPMETFGGFVQSTQAIGAPLLDAIDDEDDPVGMLCFANCRCGTTLAVCYEDLKQHRAFNEAVRQLCRDLRTDEKALLTDFVQAVNGLAQQATPASAPSGSASLQHEIGAALIDLIHRGQVKVPTAPMLALRVLQLTRDADSTVPQIAGAIAGDPALVTALLRLANSALYARGEPVTTIPNALLRVGRKEMGQVALAACMGVVAGQTGPLASLRRELWRRSLVTAELARPLAQGRGLDGDEAFLFGLLSSLGAMLGSLCLDVYLAGQPKLPSQPFSWWRHVIELFSAELGEAAAKAWNLAPGLKALVTHPTGHAPPDSEHAPLIALIHALDAVAALAVTSSAVSAENLAAVPGLASAAERARAAELLPQIVPRVASLFDAGPAPAPAATVQRGPARPRTVPAAAMTVLDLGNGRRSLRCRALGADVLVVEAPAPIAEQTFLSLELQSTPPLPFWASVTGATPSGAGFELELAPFGMSADAHGRWGELVAQLTRR